MGAGCGRKAVAARFAVVDASGFTLLISRGTIMRMTFAVLSALLVGVALGAAGVHELHAQSKPPVYVVTEIAVRNLTGYVNDYAPRAQESIKKAGGKILAASLNVTQLEGPAPTRVVIQVWDSPEQIAAYAHGSDYDELRKVGERYAKFRSFAVEGLPR
jgi:uncharacterized protein (DUF1330 family)